MCQSSPAYDDRGTLPVTGKLTFIHNFVILWPEAIESKSHRHTNCMLQY